MFHPCSIQCAQSCSVPSALSLIEYASRVRTRVLVAGSGVSVSYKSNGGIRPFSPASSVASPRFSLFAFDAISSATTMVQGRRKHRASVPSLCTTSPPEFPPFPFAHGIPLRPSLAFFTSHVLDVTRQELRWKAITWRMLRSTTLESIDRERAISRIVAKKQ